MLTYNLNLGTPVVDACVRSETNYCDITGESQWVRSVIDGYHDQAASKKLKVVNCCGFDCIPADMGVSKHTHPRTHILAIQPTYIPPTVMYTHMYTLLIPTLTHLSPSSL